MEHPSIRFPSSRNLGWKLNGSWLQAMDATKLGTIASVGISISFRSNPSDKQIFSKSVRRHVV